MDKKYLRELLDNVYELEALVHLALLKDDCSQDLLRLIERKRCSLVKNCEENRKSEEDSILHKHDETSFTSEKPIEEYSLEDDQDEAKGEFSRNDEIDGCPGERPRGRLVFSVNDRFRYRKSLFNDSDADFNTTLAFVASMENYSEAEDYFLRELSWNGDSEEVKGFLSLIKKYFH